MSTMTKIRDQLRDANSRFWRTYDSLFGLYGAGFIILFVLATFSDVTNPWVLLICGVILLMVMTANGMKFRLTKSPKDSPYQKWWSFRHAQRFIANEFTIFPQGYSGSGRDLEIVNCGRCGVRHGYLTDEAAGTRNCRFNGCHEILFMTTEYKEAACERLKIQRERNDLVRDIAVGPFRYAATHLWDLSEKLFKLMGWMLLGCGVFAAGREFNLPDVRLVGAVLCGVWVLNLIVAAYHMVRRVEADMIPWVAANQRQEKVRLVAYSVAWVAFVLATIYSLQTVIGLLESVFINIGKIR